MKNSNDLSGFILVFIILFFKILLIYSGMNVMQNYPKCSVAKINKTQETLKPSFIGFTMLILLCTEHLNQAFLQCLTILKNAEQYSKILSSAQQYSI